MFNCRMCGHCCEGRGGIVVSPTDMVRLAAHMQLPPEQVAERIIEHKRAGADLILMGFLHFQEEVEHFGKNVIPLVRELEAQEDAALQAAE